MDIRNDVRFAGEQLLSAMSSLQHAANCFERATRRSDVRVGDLGGMTGRVWDAAGVVRQLESETARILAGWRTNSVEESDLDLAGVAGHQPDGDLAKQLAELKSLLQPDGDR